MNCEDKIRELEEKVTNLEAQIQGLPTLVLETMAEVYASMPSFSRSRDNPQEPQEYT